MDPVRPKEARARAADEGVYSRGPACLPPRAPPPSLGSEPRLPSRAARSLSSPHPLPPQAREELCGRAPGDWRPPAHLHTGTQARAAFPPSPGRTFRERPAAVPPVDTPPMRGQALVLGTVGTVKDGREFWSKTSFSLHLGNFIRLF